MILPTPPPPHVACCSTWTLNNANATSPLESLLHLAFSPRAFIQGLSKSTLYYIFAPCLCFLRMSKSTSSQSLFVRCPPPSHSPQLVWDGAHPHARNLNSWLCPNKTGHCHQCVWSVLTADFPPFIIYVTNCRIISFCRRNIKLQQISGFFPLKIKPTGVQFGVELEWTVAVYMWKWVKLSH